MWVCHMHSLHQIELSKQMKCAAGESYFAWSLLSKIAELHRLEEFGRLCNEICSIFKWNLSSQEHTNAKRTHYRTLNEREKNKKQIKLRAKQKIK